MEQFPYAGNIARDKPCLFNGCQGFGNRRGWCNAHYHRWRKFGDPAIENAPRRTRAGTGTETRRSGLPCKFKGCISMRHTRGWCAMHYYRWKMKGDPSIVSRLQPRKGQGKGRRINGKYFTPIRLAYYESHGPIPRCQCPKAEALHIVADPANPKNILALSEEEHAKLFFTKWDCCKVQGCENNTTYSLRGGAHGYCKRHYTQINTHGKIISVEKVPRGMRTQFHRPPHLTGANIIPSSFKLLPQP